MLLVAAWPGLAKAVAAVAAADLHHERKRQRKTGREGRREKERES